MDYIPPSDLKTIMHSKRANIYYLEYCRLLVKGGSVEYVTDEGKKSLYWNIPIANTSTILLGTGTSITQAAMREFAKAGVLVGFCGGGGTPLFTAVEAEIDIAWLTPQSEYRPTEYLQSWVGFWFEESKRLACAKQLQINRIGNIRSSWLNNTNLSEQGFIVDGDELTSLLESATAEIETAADVGMLLIHEASLPKNFSDWRFSQQTTEVSQGQKRGKA